jgi:hypothetical protein
MTIHEFLRALDDLGSKSDGEPGGITLWRGFEKPALLARGADLVQERCGKYSGLWLARVHGVITGKRDAYPM